MKYDINLFARIINFIVKHDDEPELYIQLEGKIYIYFTCYKNFIDVIMTEGEMTLSKMSPIDIENNSIKFKNILDFLDNLIINGKSLRKRWNEVEYIDDEQIIDYSKEPIEQFLIINGQICYTPKSLFSS